MNDVTEVHVLNRPGIYVASSLMSQTVYVVDSRLDTGVPRWFRATGRDSMRGRFDFAWQPATALISMPVEWNGSRWLTRSEVDTTTKQWTLRVGSSHTFHTPDLTGRNGGAYWVASSACRAIEQVDELPDWLAAP
ncbi:hypothetical protein QQX13_12160 [Demequina sp. SYSU T00068]|uniref:hypothetical protein n=1 Tax=Demequina lignilytica TaxID=3051663 RepID=UPI00261EA6A6|nr:hypothetical protein [Demequina sp. SYSU T00068]MDN4491588.1 hypothetical protein [Demequina sp. SYSU T00068]